jgi:hypothetical protein
MKSRYAFGIALVGLASLLALLLPLGVLTFRRRIPILKPHSTTS